MVSLTQKERETLLILFKDFTTYYNANSISKVLGISHVGAQKIFKRLFRENLVTRKTIGKSITYKPNFSEDYVNQLIAFLLADEADKFRRWKEEFHELFNKNRIVMLFGSAIKDYARAKDIDLMIMMENKDLQEINQILKRKEEILPKNLHVLKLTIKDLKENLKQRNKAIIDIVKNAIVLSGQEKYVGVIKDVTSF